jgi:hypothetical protein
MEFINIINKTNMYSIDKTDYSQIKFNIESTRCVTCNLDGYSLILEDYSLFKSFLNFKSIYLLKIFNMYKNISKI